MTFYASSALRKIKFIANIANECDYDENSFEILSHARITLNDVNDSITPLPTTE